ncbi:MAG TPA: AMP-binding protein, partial [Stellaceae bacterium]|nr:AMP-binding protein [Stellaceae bacterium]
MIDLNQESEGNVMSQSQIDAAVSAQAAELTIGSLFSHQAKFNGARIALREGAKSLTYAALDARVNRLVHALATSGIVRGDRLAILSENRSEYIEAELACAKLGAILACQNWRLADEELAYCIRLTEPKLLLVSPRFTANLARIDHGVPKTLTLGEDYERFLARASDAAPPDIAHPEDGVVILYTSGTTGLPKGAMISQRAMLARAIIGQLDRFIDPESTFVAWAPLFHMVSTDNVFGVLTRGGTVVVIDGFNAGALVETIARERIGWLTLMPGMIDQVIAELKRTGAKPVGINTLGCMADLVPRHQIAEITALLGAPYVNSFGSTETGS